MAVSASNRRARALDEVVERAERAERVYRQSVLGRERVALTLTPEVQDLIETNVVPLREEVRVDDRVS